MAFAGGAKSASCSAVTCDLSTIAAGCGGATKSPSLNDRDASSAMPRSDAGRSDAGKHAGDDEDASTASDDDAGAR